MPALAAIPCHTAVSSVGGRGRDTAVASLCKHVERRLDCDEHALLPSKTNIKEKALKHAQESCSQQLVSCEPRNSTSTLALVHIFTAYPGQTDLPCLSCCRGIAQLYAHPAPACAEVPAARNALGTLAIPCAPELAATHQGEPWYRFHETHAWCPIASEDLDKAWILAHHW